ARLVALDRAVELVLALLQGRRDGRGAALLNDLALDVHAVALDGHAVRERGRVLHHDRDLAGLRGGALLREGELAVDRVDLQLGGGRGDTGHRAADDGGHEERHGGAAGRDEVHAQPPHKGTCRSRTSEDRTDEAAEGFGLTPPADLGTGAGGNAAGP